MELPFPEMGKIASEGGVEGKIRGSVLVRLSLRFLLDIQMGTVISIMEKHRAGKCDEEWWAACKFK